MVIGVVIPCYRVKRYISDVLSKIGPEVSRIYCVDDACPEKSGKFIEETIFDPRITVLFHKENKGVGGAVISGYEAALQDGVDVIVKLDGDGQMDPGLIPRMIHPIITGQADYTKGDRFYAMEYLKGMPLIRKCGNALLSFLSKFSTGYWNIFDPTNGYTALSAAVARELPFDKIARRYFFESDMLFQLNLLRAVVRDIPFRATYQGEISSLRINKILSEFLYRHCTNFMKRIFYTYFIRNFTLGSIELALAIFSLFYGIAVGSYNWFNSITSGILASPGTVMLSALPIVIGLQLLLAFFGEDITMVPKVPIQNDLYPSPNAITQLRLSQKQVIETVYHSRNPDVQFEELRSVQKTG